MKKQIPFALLISAFLLLLAPTALANIITVDDDAPADFDNIQAAIDAAVNGDTVLVAEGTYTGPGNRDIDFEGKAIAVKSQTGPQNCIIDCQATAGNQHRGFYFHSGENPASVLDGFTITGGYLKAADIYRNSPFPAPPAYPGIESKKYGGGIYCKNSKPTITNCIITSNIADAGGGIAMCNPANPLPLLTNCLITANKAKYTGGGIYCAPGAIIKNCTISDNKAEDAGGGYYGYGSSNIPPDFEDGATLWRQQYNSKIENSILWNNSADLGPQIAFAYRLPSPPPPPNPPLPPWLIPLDSSQSNTVVIWVKYSDVHGGIDNVFTGDYIKLIWLAGNMNNDPCFVEPGFWDGGLWNDGDFHLNFDSPCIDAGDPCYVPAPNETDLDGSPRIIAGRIDMGAYEFNNTPVADAGPNTIAYAEPNGIANVTLDGTGSYDEDAQPLTYLWTWTIDGNDYDANGPTPTIQLPVGEHIIQLIVSDGIDDSEPDEVTITVIAPIQARLCLLPRKINRQSKMKRVMAWVQLPEGITKDQIDQTTPLLLYPGPLEPIKQYIFEHGQKGRKRTSIFLLYDKAELMAAVPDNGRVDVQVVGMLTTGRYFYGTDFVTIIGRQQHHQWRLLRKK